MNSLIIKSIIVILIVGIVICAFVFLKNKRKEITLMLCSCIIALFTGEFFLRIFLPQISDHSKMFEYDAMLGWKFISNGKGKIIYPGKIRNTIETNSLGFRDHAPSSNRQKRLLVLGDSFVSNISVKDNEVFTEVMEDQLKDYDVLNFGVNGYGQVQEYLLLKKWFDEINPDLIVLIIYLQNDFTDNMGNYWLYSRPSASLEGEDSTITIHPQSITQPQKSKNSWDILSKSHLYRLVARVIAEKKLSSENHSEFVPEELYSCQWPIAEAYYVKYRIMEKLLLKVAEFGKDKNVPVVFALAPSIIQIDDEVWASFLEKYDNNEATYMRSLPNDRLMQFAKRNDLSMIDFFPVLHKKNREQGKLYHSFEQHWNAEGNRVVADFLLEYLKSNSLIE